MDSPYNKVKCRKTRQMFPKLNSMKEEKSKGNIQDKEKRSDRNYLFFISFQNDKEVSAANRICNLSLRQFFETVRIW